VAKRLLIQDAYSKEKPLLALFISTSNVHILDKTMVKNRGLTICQSSDSLADLFIILTSSNECMAYLTPLLFTVVSMICEVTNPLLCYRI
jgi:hypothetical protein